MSINTHILNASGRISGSTSVLKRVSKDAIRRSTKLVPIDDVDIVLYENPRGTVEGLGVGGFTPSANLVYISLEPSRADFNELVNQHLLETIAHELHHALRWRSVEIGITLLDALVAEGLADHFAMEVSGRRPEWSRTLTQRQIQSCSRIAREHYRDTDYDQYEWFLGANEKKLPKWAGYSVGFDIVEAFLNKHPSQRASTLFTSKSDTFV